MRERFFSEFLIIGIGNSEDKRKTQQLGPGKYMADTSFMYFEENKNDDRRRVIKDFCFPCGINLNTSPGIDFIKRQLIKDKSQNQ